MMMRLFPTQNVVRLAISLALLGGLAVSAPLCAEAKSKKNTTPVEDGDAYLAEPYPDDVPNHDTGLQEQPPTSLLNTLKKKPAAAAVSEAPSPSVEKETAKNKDTEEHPDEKSAAKGKKTKGHSEAAEAKPSYQMDQTKLSAQTLKDIQHLTVALQEQSQVVFNELKDDQELALKDIAMLWQAAVERSGTIRYAIEKLSRRDATGKVAANDSLSKRLLQSAARVGGVAGSMWTGTPAGILGGNMVEQLMHSDPTDPSQLRVTDADMLILAKEVDALQSQVIETYYQYRHAEERWKIAKEATNTLESQYGQHNQATKRPSAAEQALKPLMDSMVQTAEQEENTQKQSFVNARNTLGLLVGGDALLALEKAHQE